MVYVGDSPDSSHLGTSGIQSKCLATEARKKKLSAELANGRLAMMAIIGPMVEAPACLYTTWLNYLG
jgi:hypothetical protein